MAVSTSAASTFSANTTNFRISSVSKGNAFEKKVFEKLKMININCNRIA